MYRWIVEADIYRLRKALRSDPGSDERRVIAQRLAQAEARLARSAF